MPDHDSLYHRFFSHPEMVADLLQDFLDPVILKELDLCRMRRVNTKLTAPEGQRRRGDVVWEIPVRSGGNLYLLLILEFQSTVDGWMPLRLHVYTGLLHQQLVEERKLKPEQGLPPVLGIVLYNGEPRWEAATSLRQLIRLPDGSPLWNFQPEMRYHVIDEGRFPGEGLKGRNSLSALLFRLEHPTSPDDVLAAGQELAGWFQKHPDGPPVKRLFREFLIGSLQRIKGLEDLPPIPEDLQEVVNMLAARVEQWSKDIEIRGVQIGRQEGEAALLLRLLQRRFGSLSPDLTEKVRSADQSTLEMWGERVLDAKSLDDVFV